MGFYAAIKLRRFSWEKLLQTGSVDHGLLLPILFHCVLQKHMRKGVMLRIIWKLIER